MTAAEQGLLHRRQFLLGPRALRPTPDWQVFDVPGGRVLSAHPDLEIATSSTPDGALFGIGCLIDPLRPTDTSVDVLQRLAARATTAADLIAATDGVGGRWALLYVSPDESIVFHDPIGLRQVYYYTGDDVIWCGSQPEIIRAATPLRATEDPLLREFLASTEYAASEGAVYGEVTPYASCFHLLPNHYLDLSTGEPTRFFPHESLPVRTVADTIPVAAQLLRGTFDAMAHRGRPMLAVTAGWDSRLLLAAARDHIETTYCYVDQMGKLGRRNPDARVPERLAEQLGFDFTVEDSSEEPPAWFVELLQKNVTGARSLPKTRSIYAKWKRGERRVNINGNGGEICRIYSDKPRPDPRDVTPQLLIERFPGLPPGKLALREVTRWFSALTDRLFTYHPFDLLYWEQRMGNWGALYPAEQDIAVEEISPYNNRLLITTLLAVPPELRKTPDYLLHHELAEQLWPGVMSQPVNPDTLPPILRKTVTVPKNVIRSSLPEPLFRKLRGLAHKVRH